MTKDNSLILKEASDSLDKRGLHKIADHVDDVLGSYSKIKVAQFVGIQGYAVRNSRCWGNCYRQKRAKKQELSAQEVWEECWEEYKESINNPESGWEKYASKDDNFKKFASDHKKTISKIVDNFKKHYERSLEEGYNHGESFVIASNEIVNDVTDRLLDNAEKLSMISVKLNEEGLNEEAAKLSGVANSFIKEAQFSGTGRGGFMGIGKAWDAVKNRFRSGFSADKATRWLDNLRVVLNKAFKAGLTARKNNDPASRNQYVQLAQNLQDAIGNQLGSLKQVLNNDPNAQPVFDSLMKIQNTGVGHGRLGAIREALNAIQQYKVYLSQVKQKEKQDQAGQQQSSGQQSSESEQQQSSNQYDFVNVIKNNLDNMFVRQRLNDTLGKFNLRLAGFSGKNIRVSQQSDQFDEAFKQLENYLSNNSSNLEQVISDFKSILGLNVTFLDQNEQPNKDQKTNPITQQQSDVRNLIMYPNQLNELMQKYQTNNVNELLGKLGFQNANFSNIEQFSAQMDFFKNLLNVAGVSKLAKKI